jgi:ribosomal protein L35
MPYADPHSERARTTRRASVKRYRKTEKGQAIRKEARRRYNERTKKLKRQALSEWKMAVGCMDCGYAEHPAALDFDHRDPAAKAYGVGRMVTNGWAVIMAEIAKCDVVCANCHRIRTSG